MARPLWSGALSFGIVTIPVALYTAVHEHAIHFHQISKSEHRRIHYRKVVEGSDDPIPDGDIVKGYEVRTGSYVVFEDDELKRLAARKSTTIDITSFTELSDIDPRYFHQLYYLVPTGHGEKPYRLLLQALSQANRVGIAQMVMHGAEHLVAVRSLGSVLVLQTLRFADEISDPKRIMTRAPKGAVAAKELHLATQLIESMGSPFTPSAYKDDFRARLSAAIARKAKGRTVAVEEDVRHDEDDGRVLDLMTALDRSLRARQAQPRTRRAGHGAPAPSLRMPSRRSQSAASGRSSSRTAHVRHHAATNHPSRRHHAS